MDILLRVIMYFLTWPVIWFSDYEDVKSRNVQNILFVFIYTVILILIQVLTLRYEVINFYYIFGGIWLFLHIIPSLLLVLTSPNKTYKIAYAKAMSIIFIVSVVVTVVTIFIS